jgi:hypothetical protein
LTQLGTGCSHPLENLLFVLLILLSASCSKIQELSSKDMLVAKSFEMSLFKKCFFTALLVFWLAVAPAYCAEISLKQATEQSAGEASFTLPVSAIGKLELPNGCFKVKGQQVEIFAVPDWLFDRHTVLTGKLLTIQLKSAAGAAAGANASDSSASQVIEGFFVLDGGEWLKDLNQGLRGHHHQDQLTTLDGSVQRGRVQGVTGNKLALEVLPGQVKTFPLNSIADISSKTVYRFQLPVNDIKLEPASQSLTATATKALLSPSQNVGDLVASGKLVLPKSTLPGTEGGIKKSTIVGMLAVDAVQTLAPIVAMPIVIPLGERSAKNNLTTFGQFDKLNSILDLPPQPSAIARF